MKRGLIFVTAYCTLGSVFAPPTMRWLNSCHMCPLAKDCIIYGVMLTILAASVAIAMLLSRGRRLRSRQKLDGGSVLERCKAPLD